MPTVCCCPEPGLLPSARCPLPEHRRAYADLAGHPSGRRLIPHPRQPGGQTTR